MLIARGHSAIPGIGAEYTEHWALAGALRVFVSDFTGGVLEEAVLGQRGNRRKQGPDTNCAIAVLSGELLVRAAGRAVLVRAGEVALVGGEMTLRVEPAGTRFVSATFQFQDDNRVRLDVASMAAPTYVGVASLVHALRSGEHVLVAASLMNLLESLAADGIVIPHDPREIVTPSPAVFQDIARFIAHVASQPSQAALVSLEDALGLSPRQTLRAMKAFAAHCSIAGGGFRDAMIRTRAHIGSMMLTAPGATTESVARFLGYSDPTSYCRLHAALDLPSPGNLARAIRTAT